MTIETKYRDLGSPIHPIIFPVDFSDDDLFMELCQKNPLADFERTKHGNVLLMSPTGSQTSKWNAKLNFALSLWNEKHKLGQVFDSSVGFKMPDTAIYGPDVSWVSNERWNALTKEEQEKFAPVVPEFIIELCSKTDNPQHLKTKLETFMAQGCQLAWLVDPYQKQTLVYTPDDSINTIPFEEKLTGGEVLPQFEVTLANLLQ